MEFDRYHYTCFLHFNWGQLFIVPLECSVTLGAVVDLSQSTDHLYVVAFTPDSKVHFIGWEVIIPEANADEPDSQMQVNSLSRMENGWSRYVVFDFTYRHSRSLTICNSTGETVVKSRIQQFAAV
jgi:hypothetical protein